MLNDRADRLSNFMYSDDASDAKAHDFFKGTNWGELHSKNPPFPAVANYKYSRRSSIDHVGTSKQIPYDKILRDEVFGEDAMKAREGAGFVDYTFYRLCHCSLPSFRFLIISPRPTVPLIQVVE